MKTRPDLLYVSPVVPSTTGNGLAMRSGMVLEALAERFSVSLLVIALYAGASQVVPEELARRCRRIAIVKPRGRGDRRSLNPGFWSRWFGPLAFHRRYDVAHIFRLAAWSAVRSRLPVRPARSTIHLDLDDIESVTHGRIAALCRANGDMPQALFEESEARRCREAERAAFQEVDRVYVCSELDKAKIESLSLAAVCVLPNAVRCPDSAPPVLEGQCFRFLFIGTLGYYPNEDAGIFFCREVLPRIRKLSERKVAFQIVGGGASPRLRRIAGECEAKIVGPVDAVGPSYTSADAVVVPVRAGGGTRIKILEAFSYRRPVVSTSLGAEGLHVCDRQEILIADEPEAFAQACVILVHDRELRRFLTDNALDAVHRSYGLNAVSRAIAHPNLH